MTWRWWVRCPAFVLCALLAVADLVGVVIVKV